MKERRPKEHKAGGVHTLCGGEKMPQGENADTPMPPKRLKSRLNRPHHVSGMLGYLRRPCIPTGYDFKFYSGARMSCLQRTSTKTIWTEERLCTVCFYSSL